MNDRSRSDPGDLPESSEPRGTQRSERLAKSLRNAEESWKARAETVAAPIRKRLDEPVRKATVLTKRTLAIFPVRVWRHFLRQSGFLLSAGMSYQALFAVFAGVYVVFAVAGIWLNARPDTLNALITLVNTYVPGLLGPSGVISEQELQQVSTENVSLFGITGAVALGGLVWTAIGWITYSRIAVRTVFGLARDERAYLLLKTRDFLAAIVFGTVLIAAAVLSAASTAAASWVLKAFGIQSSSPWVNVIGGAAGTVAVLIIDTGVLAVMFRFLSGAAMTWRRLWGGSLAGGIALAVLQLLSGILLSTAGSNPLLATFAIFIGLLLWFRFTSIITLVAAAWIAVAATDRNESLRKVTADQLDAERKAAEEQALIIAAEVRVRDARNALSSAAWYGRVTAKRRLHVAETELVRLKNPSD